MFVSVVCLMIQRLTRSIRTDTIFLDTTLLLTDRDDPLDFVWQGGRLGCGRDGGRGDADGGHGDRRGSRVRGIDQGGTSGIRDNDRSEEHKSELHSLMRNSNAIFCLK